MNLRRIISFAPSICAAFSLVCQTCCLHPASSSGAGIPTALGTFLHKTCFLLSELHQEQVRAGYIQQKIIWGQISTHIPEAGLAARICTVYQENFFLSQDLSWFLRIKLTVCALRVRVQSKFSGFKDSCTEQNKLICSSCLTDFCTQEFEIPWRASRKHLSWLPR